MRNNNWQVKNIFVYINKPKLLLFLNHINHINLRQCDFQALYHHINILLLVFSPLWNDPECRTPKVKEKNYPLSLKNEKSEMHWICFQVIIYITFQYWRPIVLDWFPCETCQFSFKFQFATASVQGHSLCWITKRLFSWPLPCILTVSLWSGCQINCDLLIWSKIVTT